MLACSSQNGRRDKGAPNSPLANPWHAWKTDLLPWRQTYQGFTLPTPGHQSFAIIIDVSLPLPGIVKSPVRGRETSGGGDGNTTPSSSPPATASNHAATPGGSTRCPGGKHSKALRPRHPAASHGGHQGFAIITRSLVPLPGIVKSPVHGRDHLNAYRHRQPHCQTNTERYLRDAFGEVSSFLGSSKRSRCDSLGSDLSFCGW